MKKCLSNVAEVARNHDIFGPIDERISRNDQAVRKFYTAFSSNAGKPAVFIKKDVPFIFVS